MSQITSVRSASFSAPAGATVFWIVVQFADRRFVSFVAEKFSADGRDLVVKPSAGEIGDYTQNRVPRVNAL
jgi:hypothetical protein